MKITVDTEKDSKEEIRKIIQILSELAEEEKKPIVAQKVEIKPVAKPVAEKQETIDFDADELLKVISTPKKTQQPKEKMAELGLPKSAKEAIELAEELETY